MENKNIIWLSLILVLGAVWVLLICLTAPKPQQRVTLPDAHPVIPTVEKSLTIPQIVQREVKKYHRDPVYKCGVTHKVTPELFLNLIRTESSFDPKVKSSHGAIGLTQVMPKWHMESLKSAGIAERESDLYHPETNIRAGVYVLMNYAMSSRSIEEALSKYNTGRVGPVGRLYANKIMKGE